MKLTPLIRAAALDLSARLDLTFQQTLGGLLLLSEHDAELPSYQLSVAVESAFGLVDAKSGQLVINQLERADLVRKSDHPGWWKVVLP